jgi:hypothetical protein
MYKPPDMDGQLYPAWANSLAWLISMFPILAIPAWFLYKVLVLGGYQVSLYYVWAIFIHLET